MQRDEVVTVTSFLLNEYVYIVLHIGRFPIYAGTLLLN